MATKYKFDGTGNGDIDNGVHFNGVMSDYTLCGITLDGDYKSAGEFYKTNDKVDCGNCLTIVAFCKTIKSSECIYHK